MARLHGAEHTVIPDRIETGTYMMAAAITGGEVELVGARHDLVAAVGARARRRRRRGERDRDGLQSSRRTGPLAGVDVMTEPFPGFPTDLQAQMMALMSTAEGAAMITETIFENRFMHVPELCRMGANINVHGASAMVRGVRRLTGAPVMATDLRASVSLVLAGLVAEGETMVNRVYHLDRGYERLEEKLAACGAGIERLPGEGEAVAAASALKLRAEDADDIAVLSAVLQDALVTVGEMAWLADERRFVLVANRFRWEPEGAGERRDFERTLSGLRIDGVTSVQRRGFYRARERILACWRCVRRQAPSLSISPAPAASASRSSASGAISTISANPGRPAGAPATRSREDDAR